MMMLVTRHQLCYYILLILCFLFLGMDNRKRAAASYNSGKLAIWSSSFPRQPARVLIVEALPPWWSETSSVVCDALDNFLSLACNLDGPRRMPLLSLYAINRQQECLLPFVVRQMKINIYFKAFTLLFLLLRLHIFVFSGSHLITSLLFLL